MEAAIPINQVEAVVEKEGGVGSGLEEERVLVGFLLYWYEAKLLYSLGMAINHVDVAVAINLVNAAVLKEDFGQVLEVGVHIGTV